MLRNFVIGCGVLAFLCGLVALATGAFPPAAVFGLWGALLVIGTVFERVVYKRIDPARPGAGWQEHPSVSSTTQRANPSPCTSNPRPASGNMCRNSSVEV